MADILCGWIFCSIHAHGDDYCPLSTQRFQTRHGYLGYYVVDTADSNRAVSKPFETIAEATDYSEYLNRVDSDPSFGRVNSEEN